MYLFDLDGTITDSNGLWVEVDLEFLSRRGLTMTREYEDVVGRSIFPAAAQFTREYYRLPDRPEDIMAEWEALAAHHYRDLVLLKPGARAFLDQCRWEGRDMALFTACRPALCRLVLDRFQLTEYFLHIVYAEEMGLDKHDPRCFARLSQLLGVPPETCTLFDDNPSNCATARAAGMAAVGVYDPFYDHRQEELQSVCTRYVRSLEELVR
ncbi:MAG TPA: HAD family phosphatase [Candidatus Enterenecus stercoripullorum]|nr:HAD family phosphatase [Candidatus Enterenecus stercoripullorum]